MNKDNIHPTNKSIEHITCQHLIVDKQLTPKEVFSPFSVLPWAMWLDSCNSDHVDSRYDILVWSPVKTLSTSHKKTTIFTTETNTSTESIDDPLTLIDKTVQSVFNNVELPNTALPFNCGAIGYFSYDLGRRFETLPSLAKTDITIPEMAVGIYTQALIYDKKDHSFSLLCKANDRQHIEQQIIEKISFAQSQKNISVKRFSLSSDWQSNMSKSDYEQKFNKVHDYLLSGDCYQINLTQRFSANYRGNEFEAYETLREENNAPFSAFIRTDKTTILSVSPERFLLLKNKTVQSKPIKGTRPRNNNKALDEQAKIELTHSEKDKAENLMIVDLLRNDISKVCIAGTVKVPKLFDIESFPAVHHLVSTVVGEIAPKYSATDLLRGAFPGGSITGAPKIRAMEIIEELEPHRRSVYCGSIGYISACGNMDTSITIRTLICENNEIHCWAGGGLVADSIVESEYQETFDKVNKILPVLKKQFYKKN